MGELVPNKPTNNAFTMIEMLVVITLIGILTGILVVIINPSEKQSMAHDGVSAAMMNKIVLATEGFISAYNRFPDEEEFMHTMDADTVELFGSECYYVLTPDNECLFSIEGTSLPESCDLSFWAGSSGDEQQCNYRYQGGIQGDSGRFRLYVKSMKMVNTLFVYDNMEGGKIHKCPYNITDFMSLEAFCE